VVSSLIFLGIHILNTAILCNVLCTGLVAAYRPVIIMHGILGGYKHMEELAGFVREAHPGTEVYNVNAYNDHVCGIFNWQ